MLSEPVGLSLFASSRAAVFIADSLASTESPALTRVPAAVAPEASREKLYGPYWGPDCFQQHTFIREPKALSELIVSELTASLQKGLNACSLIIWILVNWINCWIETVLLKMTKTQGQGEQKGGINIVSVYSRAVRRHKHAWAHTHTYVCYCCVSLSSSNSLLLFHTRINSRTHTGRMWPISEEWALGKVQITMHTVGDKN